MSDFNDRPADPATWAEPERRYYGMHMLVSRSGDELKEAAVPRSEAEQITIGLPYHGRPTRPEVSPDGHLVAVLVGDGPTRCRIPVRAFYSVWGSGS